MQFQLKADAPDKVEAGIGSRAFVCERGKEPFECREAEWPALEKQGYFEPYSAPTEKPAKSEKK